jgi:hypothetical protein
LINSSSLAQLTIEFDNQFDHPSIPSLPEILSTISASVAKHGENHFFASVVQSKELIRMYHDVVLWMLKRDMLITLHLRVRVVATREIKLFVRMEREKALANKVGVVNSQDQNGLQSVGPGFGTAPSSMLWLSPHRVPHPGRRRSKDSGRSDLSELVIKESDRDDDINQRLTDEDSETDEEGLGWDTAEDDLLPSMISDPGRATPLQRRWLLAMSEGKEPHIARRFQL